MMDNLLQARLKAPATQAEMAALLGVAQNTYSRKESGHIPLTASELVILAGYFDVSVDYLLGRETTDHRPPTTDDQTWPTECPDPESIQGSPLGKFFPQD